MSFLFQFIVFLDLPVVTCEWLLACYKNAQRLPVKKFLVGDSIAPVEDVSEIEMEAVAVAAEPVPIGNSVENVEKHIPNASEL